MIKNKYLLTGSILLAFLLFVMYVGPKLPIVDTKLEGERLYFPENGKFQKAPYAPSERQWFGSDRDGRDIFSLIVMGTKETILLIFGITILRYLIAIPLGLSGYKNKGIMSKLIYGWHKLLSSLPTIFVAIIILNMPFLVYAEHRMYWAILALALLEVGRVSYIIQQQAHLISKKPYMDAGITIGMKPVNILKNYYLPNLAPDIATNFCLDIGRVALLMGQLAIFGIFMKVDFVQVGYGVSEIVNTSLEWGTMMKEARKDVVTAFWIPFYPALALAYIIFTFNILGEGLRRFFNRHLE
ncbi:ABC transporter permease [Bacillus sp. FJAT-49732]|uniref:ABC transporter permease n=1 Tax=Lederbergia citrisecunda TaxID=2833583 RepID=A0A942TQK5_9BACI|nr:ABC transporter permease subunit [Lederbergia citrisecunda]MBS4200069.1 ABC transporter permease [Lederbergia citrisecunda]